MTLAETSVDRRTILDTRQTLSPSRHASTVTPTNQITSKQDPRLGPVLAAFLSATAKPARARFAVSERRRSPAVAASRLTTSAGFSRRGSATGTARSEAAVWTTIGSAWGKRQVMIGGAAVRMAIVARPTAADRHMSTRHR